MTETPPATHTGSRPAARRWLVLLLLASLAFNLLVIGAAVAERMWPPQQRAESIRTPRVTELLPRNFFVGLDRERRTELKVVFQERRQTFRDERRALRQAAREVADALAKEPYDPERVRSAVAEYGQATRRLVDLGLLVAEDLFERLTPEERRALAEHIRDRAEPRSRRKPD